jgi:hypothetical protein
MGVRETLNRHRVIAAIVVFVSMIAAAAFVYRQRPRQTYFSSRTNDSSVNERVRKTPCAKNAPNGPLALSR